MPPWRQRTGFEPEARQRHTGSDDPRVHVVGFRGHFAFPNDDAVFVDDAWSTRATKERTFARTF
jgi:hypothetical protein